MIKLFLWYIFHTVHFHIFPLCNPIQAGHFRGSIRLLGQKRPTLLWKICGVGARGMKHGKKVSLYVKLWEMINLPFRPLKFCWYHHFLTKIWKFTKLEQYWLTTWKTMLKKVPDLTLLPIRWNVIFLVLLALVFDYSLVAIPFVK